MKQLDNGFSAAVDCKSVQAIYNALTSPCRGAPSEACKVDSEETHLRVVLSYRHEDPRKRSNQEWPHRQRAAENDYQEIAKRSSDYACNIGAATVSMWTDQHFAGAQEEDTWRNNCLLPYAIYPVVYYGGGDNNKNNHERLWICASISLQSAVKASYPR